MSHFKTILIVLLIGSSSAFAQSKSTMANYCANMRLALAGQGHLLKLNDTFRNPGSRAFKAREKALIKCWENISFEKEQKTPKVMPAHISDDTFVFEENQETSI